MIIKVSQADGVSVNPFSTNVFQVFLTTIMQFPITQLICSLKEYNVGEMKTDIKANLLDDSIIVNTFEKVI